MQPREAGPGIINNLPWIVRCPPCFQTILFSVYLKGFWSQLPLFLGMVVGALVAGIILATTKVNLFRQLPETVAHQGLFALPHFTIPKFTGGASRLCLWLSRPSPSQPPISISGCLSTISPRKLAPKRNTTSPIAGSNLIGDGIGDIVAGFVGGPAGTNLR